jgi:periplasmic divalent cation tolerance protein
MSEPRELILVISTVETADDADRIARALVDQSLAACVQIDGPIRSHYRWSGQVETATEYRLMIKSSRAAWPRLLEKLAKMHPYDEPEIITLTVSDAAAGYRDWVIDQTT